MTIYLAGCGKLGKRLGTQLSADGERVIGLKRRPETAAFPMIGIDLSDKVAVEKLTADASVIVFTVTPSDYSEAAYAFVYKTVLQNLIAFAQRHEQPPLFILVSSTSVYGQHDGEWVNEQSPTVPTHFSGQHVLGGEQAIRAQLSRSISLRCSGIYGQGRTRLIQRAVSGQAVQQTPPIWTNRVHEDDCIGALRFLIQQAKNHSTLAPVYLLSDDTPVSIYDITAFICRQLKQAPPPIKTEEISTKQNKRCDNSLIKSAGYSFKHPDFRCAYQALIADFLASWQMPSLKEMI